MPMMKPRMVGRLGGLAIALCLAVPVFGQANSITIDDQPTAEQKLAEVNDLRQAGRYDDAAELVQELIDGARFKLVSTGPGRYVDAELWTRRELSRDADLRSAYRSRYTAAAERVVGEAIASRSGIELREAYRRYALTRPGMDAGMMLAGLLLESGDPAAAHTVIQELVQHPDAAARRGDLLAIRGAIAALMGDKELVQDVLGDMEEEGWRDLAAGLRTLAGSVTDPVTGWSRPVVDAGPEPESLNLPLWIEPMARRNIELGTVRQQVDGLRVIPSAARDMVFVNTGRQLLAMDRAAGPVLWAYPDGNDGDQIYMDAPGRRAVWQDTRGVAVEGGRAYAVLGECYGLNGNGREDVLPNRFVCLDASTGVMLWSREAGEVKEGEPLLFDDRRGDRVNLLQSHFVGTPIVSEGQVLVMLRRASQQGLQTTWLLAFDSGTGELRWLRHLALAQIRQDSGASRVTPQMTLAGDTIYVTDSIGVAAAVDARSGAYKWLTVLAEDTGWRNNQLVLQTDGVLTPPVMTRSGLVVPLTLTSHRLTLLDPEDGAVLRDLSEDRRLVGCQYILDVAGDVLVVSKSSVTRWDGEDAAVSWSYELEAEPRGRGDLSRAFAVVPTTAEAVVIGLETGELLRKVADLTGNIVVLEEEVLVSSGGQLSSYMTWQQAYDRLVRRIDQRPNDPDAGLALASLALRQGEHDEAVMQGVDYAMAAVDRLAGEEARSAGQRVFDRLRGLAGENREAAPELRLKLYDRLAMASRSASQEVAYHLDFGRYLVQVGDPRMAVEHFQAVMVDPAFSSQGYLFDGTTQPAGAIAQRELLKLVNTHGRSVYARFDALAWQRLEMLRQRPDTEPAAFAQIAQRYPLAQAASPALLAAGEVLRRRGEHFGELSYCQQAVARAVDDEQRNTALGAMLAVHLQNGDREQARQVVLWVGRQFPGMRPVRDGVPTELAAWVASVDAMPGKDRVHPDLPENLDTAVILPGRLVQPAPGLDVTRFAQRLYLFGADGLLRQFESPDHDTPRWAVPVSGRQFYLLADDHGQTLIWSVQQQQIIALDTQTGEELWRRPADISQLSHQSSGELIGGWVFEQDLPQVVVTPTMVCLADRGGLVLGIDRYLGTPLWQYRTGLTRMTSMSVDGWALAVAGLDGPELQLKHGRVMILDLLTGEPQLAQIDLHVGFPPELVTIRDGRVVVVGDTELAAFELEAGAQLWKASLPETPASGRFGLAGNMLAVEDRSGMLNVFDLEQNGQLVGRHAFGTELSRNTPNDRSDTQVLPSAGELWVCGLRGVGRFGARGHIGWRDTIELPGKRFYGVAMGATRLAAILSLDDQTDPDQIQPEGNTVEYMLCVMEREGGRLLAEYRVGPVRGQLDPREMRLTQGALLIPMGPETLLLKSSATPRGGAQ